MTICWRCNKEVPDSEMNMKELACRSCVKKKYYKEYRLKQKEKKLKKKLSQSEYFKKWYKERGRFRRKEKHIPTRNRRLYEMYLDRKRRHLSVEAIAKMFQISSATAYHIIAEEKKKTPSSQ